MFLGRVIGRVVSTRRISGTEGVKFLVVEPIDRERKRCGTPLVAVDIVHSGQGDTVLLEDGREASMALEETFVPVDAAIVGHVEELAVAPEYSRRNR